MPVSARETENTMEQILLLCQLCRAKVAANTRKHLMKASLHSLLLPNPTESLRQHQWNNTKTKNSSLSGLWQRVGTEALGSQGWGEGCSFPGAGNSEAKPSLVQVPQLLTHNQDSAKTARSCLRAMLYPKPPSVFSHIPTAACLKIGPQQDPTLSLQLLAASSELAWGTLHHRRVLPCPSSSLLSGFQGTKQDRRYSGSCSSAEVETEGCWWPSLTVEDGRGADKPCEGERCNKKGKK